MENLEQKIKGHGKPITATKLSQIIKKGEDCTCKIISLNSVATGFFCKIKQDIFLFTNNHVLDQNFINYNSNLAITYKNQEKIIDLENRKKITNADLDYTIIEIKDKDGINDYFEVDYYIDSKKSQYLNKDIGILQYPNGNELSFDKGEIKEIKRFILTHTVSTDFGSSGSPIFLIYNLRIIGIHKGRVGNINSGIFMKNILDNLYPSEILELSPFQDKSQEPELNITNIDGENAIVLLQKCPIEGCYNDKDIIFKHVKCGEIQYINESGKVICKKCGIKNNFHSCKFNCNLHPNYLFPSKDCQRLIACFALLGRLRSEGGKKFLKNLLDSLLEDCDSD